MARQTDISRRAAIGGLCTFPLATRLGAAPAPYRLDARESDVAVLFTAAGQRLRATVPVRSAQVALDLADPARSQADVVLDVTGTTTPLPFATQTLRGPDILDAARFATARFRTTTFAGTLNGGTLRGELTLRGRTRAVVLAVDVFREAGSVSGDHTKLILRMAGRLDRRDWGITAYGGVVDPIIDLAIRAVVEPV
ncbi:MAG: YceI family protein [Shimia sp.]